MMQFIGLNDEIDKVLGEYLINVLNIPQLWAEKKSLKQKDHERRILHDKLVKLLCIEDRDIISKCVEEAASPAYLKFGKLRKAQHAFYHKFNILTSRCIITPEQENKLDELYKSLGNFDNKNRIIQKNLNEYCNTVRRKHYQDLWDKYREEYSKKSPTELLEMLKKIPDTYYDLYMKMGQRSSDWYRWFEQMNYEYGNGFSGAYYDMVGYYCCVNFYHDYLKRVKVVTSGLKKWAEIPEVLKWAANTAARFQMWFDGAEEYINTTFDEIARIFISFKDNKVTNND